MQGRVCGTKSGKEVAGKIRLQGSKGSIELNINSSFCFDKNSHKHAPIKQVSRNKERLFKKPWISRGILKSIKTKHTMYKTHFLSKDPAKVNEFKKYSNRLNHLKSMSKKAIFASTLTYVKAI